MTLESNLTAAFQAVGADVKALNNRINGIASVQTSGPYSLDPLRTPEGSISFVPASDPILTHRGNRWTNAPIGVAVSTQTQTSTGSLTLGTSGACTFQTGGRVSGTTFRLVGSETAETSSNQFFAFPTGIREARVSIVTRLPRPTAGDHLFAALKVGGSEYLQIFCSAGTATTNNRYSVNSVAAGAGWEASGYNLASTETLRVAITAKISDTASASFYRVGFYNVHPDQSETQIGTTWTSNGLTFTAGTEIQTITWGKMSSVAGWESATLELDSIRVAYGTGAYPGLLTTESLYPEPN